MTEIAILRYEQVVPPYGLSFVAALLGFLAAAEGGAADLVTEYKFTIKVPPSSQIKDTGPGSLILDPPNSKDVVLVPGMTYKVTVTSQPLPPRLCTDHWSAVYRTTETKRGGLLKLGKRNIITSHAVPGRRPYPINFRKGRDPGADDTVSIPLFLMSGETVDSMFYLYPGRPEITDKFAGKEVGRLAFSKDKTGGTINLTRSNEVPEALKNTLRGQSDIPQPPKFQNRTYSFVASFPLLEVTISVQAR